MVRRHALWTPSLHPRGKGGKFAKKGSGGGQPANPEAAKVRRAGYAKVGARAGVGVAVGARSIATGHALKRHDWTVAGAGRIGLAGVEAAHGVKTVRRQTSRDFSKLSKRKQELERSKSRKRSVALGAASAASDVGLLGLTQVAKPHVKKAKLRKSGHAALNDYLKEALKHADEHQASVNRRHTLAWKARFIDNRDPFKAVALINNKKPTPNKRGVRRQLRADPFAMLDVRRGRTGVAQRQRTGRLGDFPEARARQKYKRKAKPRPFKRKQ